MGCETLGARVCELIEAPLPAAVQATAAKLLEGVSARARAASESEVVKKLRMLSEQHGGGADWYFPALIAGTSSGSPQFGALWAVEGAAQAQDRRAVVAFALGNEVALRLERAVSPNHAEVGWDAIGTCGVIGAAVTAAVLLGVDAIQLTNAIGIAAAQTLGLREAFGTTSAALHAGKAASNGVIAAKLARKGFTGMQRLDHRDGFFTAFPVSAPSRIDAVVEGLGDEWLLLA